MSTMSASLGRSPLVVLDTHRYYEARPTRWPRHRRRYRVLRVAVPAPVGAEPGRRGAHRTDPRDPHPLSRDVWGAAGPRRPGRPGLGPPRARTIHNVCCDGWAVHL